LLGEILHFWRRRRPFVPAGLDHGGVYYRDAADESIYFIPEEANRTGHVSVAVADSLLMIKSASFIQFENVAFEKTIGSAVSVENSNYISLRGCYVGHTGANGIVINGGNNDLVEDCVVDDIGQAGIAISGGDRTTLTPANHKVRHSYISHFGREMPTYRPGIHLDGVGITIEGCEIAYGSHAGILFGGNDHQIIGNIFHDLVLDTNDSGAIYTGRNWTSRGNVVQSNYFYDIANRVDSTNVIGVYLDDQISGTNVAGNVFHMVEEPILVGGGRDNVIRDNLAIGSKGSPIRIDSRGLNWQAAMAAPGGILAKELESVPYRQGVWAQRYPGLVKILEDRPGTPVDNNFVDNLADEGPVVQYDLPVTATFGVEAGSRKIGKLAFDFPASVNVPRDASAAGELEKTRKLIVQTMESIGNLPFRDREGH
jgi:Right handed beta helix region